MDNQNHNENQHEPQPSRRSSPLLVFLFMLLALIVLLILIIPNYLEPVTRSPDARVRSDQRTVTIGLETYYLDCNNYPAWSASPANNAFGELARKEAALASLPTFTMANGTPLQTLTTPVAYLTSYFPDYFAPAKGATFCYWNNGNATTTATGYILWSPGPDLKYDLTLGNIAKAYNPAAKVPSDLLISLTYDPSNGIGSAGDVYRFKN